MDKKKSVMIIRRNLDICSELEADLEVLGFIPLQEEYSDVDWKDITRNPPAIIIFELTEYNHDDLLACKLLLKEDILPSETISIALVSEDTMEQISPDYRFTDVIKIPCGITELDFRLRRVISLRQQELYGDTIRIGNLSLSSIRHEVKVDDRPIVLSHKEYELLKHFITHPDHVFTRKALLTSVWGYDPLSDSRTVDVHVRRVRAKIGDNDNKYIKTVRGTGYILRSES